VSARSSQASGGYWLVISSEGHIEDERREILEREQEARREAQTLNDLAQTLSAELDVQKLLQKVTDAATALTGAKFGAFFYNAVNDEGESYLLYTLCGAPREAFEKFGYPRNTLLFGPTFRGEGVLRIADVLQDPRYGKSSPHYGMPKGHLPVRSYLAVPVSSRTGTVFGGLFFGHPETDVFTAQAERMVQGLAAHAAIAIDNAQLYGQAQREIAERRRVEESERAARTQAERATRLRDEFLATVSHELRTPLNSVLGWTQVLRKSPADEEIRVRALDAIERGARSQIRLIEDLLDMSRIISGKLRLEVQSVELHPIVQAAIETVLPAAEAKGIRIQRILDPVNVPVKGDPARLQQVFWNLLSNALKFTPKGGKIQVHLERINSHIEVSISDNGQGIAPEYLPAVFDRFSQEDASTTRHHGGLGLGLAVVKHLVELHGGQVQAQSLGDERCGEVNLKGIRVLVVDDDADSCELLRRVLVECEAEVRTAGSASEALALLAEPFDILVSDIGMPDLDGYEFLRRLRAQGDRTPAVAVTAFARAEDRIRALQAGYNMHVSKPLEPLELLAVIASLVR
jgi:signal transduction histidine kinase/CheY-like chemotaxis protein